ncbi:hypothetical protein ACVWZZ_003912 [Bradyrhizobium sp. LM6.10]
MLERAAEPLAIDGMTAADAEQAHGDIPARAIDLNIHRPGQQTRAWYRVGGLGEVAHGIEAGDERLRAERVGDEAGGNLRHVAGPRRAEGEAGKGDGGGSEDDLAAAGHGLSPASGRVAEKEPDAGEACSPDLKIRRRRN